jgi:hypothetical protein
MATHRERDYLEDDVRDHVERILSARAERTPVGGVSTAEHELHCSRAERLETRMDNMEKTQKTHGELLAEFVGAQKFQRWAVPIITGVLASSVAAAFVAWLLKGHA